jgi:hypothetical protein
MNLPKFKPYLTVVGFFYVFYLQEPSLGHNLGGFSQEFLVTMCAPT